jgi:hypothetical protein
MSMSLIPVCCSIIFSPAGTIPQQMGINFLDTVSFLSLCLKRKFLLSPNASDPSGKQLGVLLGPADCWPRNWPGLTDNQDGGKTLHFRFGRLVSYDNQTSPFLVYGKIYEVWNKLGGIKSLMKYPLADPQFLSDESVCSVFEGGHIHQSRGSNDADVFV